MKRLVIVAATAIFLLGFVGGAAAVGTGKKLEWNFVNSHVCKMHIEITKEAAFKAYTADALPEHFFEVIGPWSNSFSCFSA